MSIRSLERAIPGDVIFYVPKEDKNRFVNLVFRVGQSFWSSLSSRGAEITHAGIILDPELVRCASERNSDQVDLPEGCDSLEDCLQRPEDYVFISHSYATSEGAHISVRVKSDLLKKYDIVAVSPIPEDGASSQEEENFLRALIVSVAMCFSTSKSNCQILPCSNRHLFIDPCITLSTLPLSKLKQCVSESIVDFAFGYPPIQKCDERGRASAKPSFCGEHVHRVLQAAFFYSQIDQKKILAMESSGFRIERNICDLRDFRKSHIQDLCDNFDGSFLQRIPSWILQNSTSFSPGRLYTALTEKSDFRANGFLRGSFAVAKSLASLGLFWQRANDRPILA